MIKDDVQGVVHNRFKLFISQHSQLNAKVKYSFTVPRTVSNRHRYCFQASQTCTGESSFERFYLHLVTTNRHFFASCRTCAPNIFILKRHLWLRPYPITPQHPTGPSRTFHGKPLDKHCALVTSQSASALSSAQFFLNSCHDFGVNLHKKNITKSNLTFKLRISHQTLEFRSNSQSQFNGAYSKCPILRGKMMTHP